MEGLLPEDPRRIGGYRVVGRLGAGGMGQVFLGRSATGMPVAIKVVHAEMAADPRFRARFAREVAAARTVSGAFTAPVIDADPQAAAPWLVTAFLPGLSLQDAVAEHGPLPVPGVYALGASLAEALVSIHRAGIVHRDLKPSNVMLAPDGPRLIDFGIAHAAEGIALTRAGAVMGSPGYLAPEQARGLPTGPAGDVFSLGAVLAFAAMGEGPFGRGNVHALIYRVVHDEPRLDGVADAELRELVAECMAKEPALRPGPEALLRRLVPRAPEAAVLRGTGWLPGEIAAAVERSPKDAGRAFGRRRVLLAGGGAVAAVAVAAGGGVLLAGRGEPRAAARTPGASASPVSTPAPAEAKVLWDYETRSYLLEEAPGAGAGIVFANGTSGAYVALDARTGKRRWGRAEREGAASAWTGAVVADGLVYTGLADDAFGALDARSGAVRWRYPVPNAAEGLPVVMGGTVYVGSRDDVLHAIDRATGARRWSRRLKGARPAAADGLVFLHTGKELHALDGATGKTRWRRAVAEKDALGVAVQGGLVCCRAEGAELVAFDARTGARRWRFLGGSGIGAPAVAGGAVYVADGSANMVALDAASGRVRWRFPAGDGGAGRPVAAGGLVCFAGREAVWAVDAGTGRGRWKYEPAENTRSDVVVAGGAVCFSSGDLNVDAVERSRYHLTALALGV